MNLPDIFGTQDAYLDEVKILPYSNDRRSTSNVAFNLPSGYVWTDFDEIHIQMGYSDGSSASNLGSSTYDNASIRQRLNDGSSLLVTYNDGSVYRVHLQLTGATTGVWAVLGGAACVQSVTGYTKRYSTRNLSAIVNVNGGANIAVNSRYEIDIATELGQDYLGRDLIVQAELYAAGNEYTGWAEMPLRDFYNNGAYYSHGVKAYSDGQKIHIYTAGYGKGVSSSNVLIHYDATNPWKNIQIFDAPCRVKVWKIDQFVSNTAGSGGGGKTVLYDGAVVGNGSNVVLNDSVNKYDMILINYAIGDSFQQTVFLEPSELLNASFSRTALVSYVNYAGNNESSIGVVVANSTETSLNVYEETHWAGNTGIYKVVGINYAS